MNNSNNIFSSKFFATIALALLVVFQSCKKNDVAEVAPVAAENNIAALSQAVAASAGVAADKVEFIKAENGFMIDGDAIVSLEDAKVRFASNGTAGAASGATQMKSPYVVASAKVSTIKIYCDATVPAVWVAAMDSAIKNWNATGSKVFIQRITTTTGATTKVTTTYNTTLTVATAVYPDYYGNAGNRITINTNHNGMEVAKKVFAITHELGHTLGMSHTAGTYGSLVAGTPITDASSIMNAVCLLWKGFTAYDLQAIRTVYPK
jgi:hypothetical protein